MQSFPVRVTRFGLMFWQTHNFTNSNVRTGRVSVNFGPAFYIGKYLMPIKFMHACLFTSLDSAASIVQKVQKLCECFFAFKCHANILSGTESGIVRNCTFVIRELCKFSAACALHLYVKYGETK